MILYKTECLSNIIGSHTVVTLDKKLPLIFVLVSVINLRELSKCVCCVVKINGGGCHVLLEHNSCVHITSFLLYRGKNICHIIVMIW